LGLVEVLYERLEGFETLILFSIPIIGSVKECYCLIIKFFPSCCLLKCLLSNVVLYLVIMLPLYTARLTIVDLVKQKFFALRLFANEGDLLPTT
jgi:hypothetical protein